MSLHKRALYRLIGPVLVIAGAGITTLKAQMPVGREPVTLVGKQMPFSDIFRAIWEQTGKQAFYNDEQLSSTERLDVNFRKVPLNKVLKTLLSHRRLSWYYREETFVIMPERRGAGMAGNNGDSITVSGIVTGPGDTPVAGATIQIKGSRRGVPTNETGVFTLSVRKPATLLITSMGYKSKVISIKSAVRERLNIRLEPAIKGLDEVLVIAYGTAVRRDVTGSISRITSADIEQQPVANALQAMQGRVTGLNIIQTSGLPGSNFKVELRGRNSINSGNNPFYIVDGVPFTATSLSWPLDTDIGLGANASSNPLNLINVADIESINVLKDADATAIYGSRGANGVVLITTKKGRIGKAKADVNIYTGIGHVAHRPQYFNTQQYLQMRQEAFHNDNEIPRVTDYDMFWDSTRYTNWQKEMLGGTASITDAQTTVSGGTANAQYAVGLGYRRETTVYPGDFAYQKAAASIRATFTSDNKKAKATIIANYVADRNNLPYTDLAVYATTPPNAPPSHDAFGDLNWEDGAYDNPLANVLRRYKSTGNNLIASAVLNYELLPGLQLKSGLGYTRMQMDEIQTNPLISLNPSFGNQNGYSLFANGSISSWIIEPQAIYERKLGNGKLSMLVGMTFQQDLRNQKAFFATGYTSDALLEDMTSAAMLTPLGVVNTQYRYNAVFGRINYKWRGKYIASLTGRRDGSSRFGPNNRFAGFGAVGAAWIFSEEKWMKAAVPFLSFGKLRGSYGVTGNDQITDYGYLDTYSPAPQYSYDRGLYPTRLFNAAYGWEKNIKLETGLDLGFANDRVLFTVNWYRNRSSNQLVNYPLPGVTGFPFIRSNLPALVENTGIELELSSVNVKNEMLGWTSSVNISIPSNKLVSFPGLAISSYNKQYTLGEPLNIFKGFKLEGVDPKEGTYFFRDMNGDGRITSPHDYTYTRQIGAVYYGGVQNTLQYRNWQLAILLQFVKQDNYNYLYTYSLAPGGPVNQPVTVLQRWQEPGDETRIQQFTQAAGSSAAAAFAMARSSDQIITDASYIRLKNFSLSWQFPEKWLRKLHLRNSQLFVQGQNLFTLTSYPGIDPETAARQEVYPPLRTLVMGLRCSF
jgi:TonB-linked SusC/RagA family outer membrane protein